MAYPGIALVAMVGVGLGLALWYFLTDTSTPDHPHSAGPPPRRDSNTSYSWDIPNNDARRRRHRRNSKAKEECPICTEIMDNCTETVKCGHMYHTSCIKKWRETQGGDPRSPVTCPLCRQCI